MATDSASENAAVAPPGIPARAGIGEVVVCELEEILRRRGQPDRKLDPAKWIDHCHFYKNRLVRCYLGASATKRRDWDNPSSTRMQCCTGWLKFR